MNTGDRSSAETSQ